MHGGTIVLLDRTGPSYGSDLCSSPGGPTSITVLEGCRGIIFQDKQSD